jgi:hypothetical protein
MVDKDDKQPAEREKETQVLAPSRFRIDPANLLVTQGPSVTWQDETCTRRS